MKFWFSSIVLLGMLLMYIPKTLIHECSESHSHEHALSKHSDHSSKDQNTPIFEEEQCQICALQLDVLDLPSASFVENQLNLFTKVNSLLNDAPLTESLNSLNSRGPPVFITL